VAALTAFRVAHHGDWVPNTARAKVAFSALTLERGAMYLGAFWTVLPAGLLVPLATLPLAVGERRRGATLAAGSLGLVLATFAYGVLVGGDFMAFHRFFLPALPFLAVLVGLLAEAARGRGRPLVALAVPALVVATSLPPAFGAHLASEPLRKATHFRWDLGYTPELAFWNGMKDRAERWSVLGRALELHTEEGESIVMGTIGAAGYYSRLFVFDRRGLVTPEVNDVPLPEGARTTPGHDRQVPASFFLARNPTYLDAYVLPAGAPTPPGTPTRRIERRPLPVEAGFPPERTLVLVLPAGRRGR
jgi:hypothetical protein